MPSDQVDRIVDHFPSACEDCGARLPKQRKRSFGARSERGHRYAERVMTIAHTKRKQNKNGFAFFTACCEAHLTGAASPSLFAAELAA